MEIVVILVLVALAALLGMCRRLRKNPPDPSPEWVAPEWATILAEADWPEIPLPPPDPPAFPPWTVGKWAGVTGLLPTPAVLHFADRSRLATIAIAEADYIEVLAGDILRHGFQEPLMMVMDVRGEICLKEGHHRLVVARRWNIPMVPVRIAPTRSPGIRQAYHRPLAELIPFLG